MTIKEKKMAIRGYPSGRVSFILSKAELACLASTSVGVDYPSPIEGSSLSEEKNACALIGKEFTVHYCVGALASSSFMKTKKGLEECHLLKFREEASFTVSPVVYGAGARVRKIPLIMDCPYNYQTHMLARPWKKPDLRLACSMMNKLRDGNDPIQMHENFGTHDGQFQEGEGGPEDNGFVHDMSLDGVADDPMQIDAVEDYPNFSTENVDVWFNQNLMGLIDTTGMDSPDQLKGAAILIAHLPAGQYIFKYVRYGQEIRMDNDDFRHFLEDLTDIHIWDGELVTVS